MKYESVLISVNYFAEGKFWIVSADAYVTDSGPDDPERYGDTDDFEEEPQALRHAENWADFILDGERVTTRVTILKNGSEHKCVTREPRETKHAN